MRDLIRHESPLAATLDRLALFLMLLVLATILTAAMFMQYALGEIPCPLCLLQRVAMFGVCFALMRQLRHGPSARSTGLCFLFSILLLVIAARQTLLDIYPRPGHDYVGSAIFGLHMPVWSVVIALALLLGLSIKLVLFGLPRAQPDDSGSLMSRLGGTLGNYVIVICAINFISVVLQCGLGECHTTGYRLL